MRIISVETFEEWRAAARDCLAADLAPAQVSFQTSAVTPSLFPNGTIPRSPGQNAATVSKLFLELAKTVSCHREEVRWNALYRVLWRLTHGEAELLDIPIDDDVVAVRRMEKSVTRDAHKAKAFVRFRRSRRTMANISLPGIVPTTVSCGLSPLSFRGDFPR